jgi:hypothetical protein
MFYISHQAGFAFSLTPVSCLDHTLLSKLSSVVFQNVLIFALSTINFKQSPTKKILGKLPDFQAHTLVFGLRIKVVRKFFVAMLGPTDCHSARQDSRQGHPTKQTQLNGYRRPYNLSSFPNRVGRGQRPYLCLYARHCRSVSRR